MASCSVCWHPMRRQIDSFIKDDQNYTPILRWLREGAKKDPTIRVYGTKDPLKRHRERCLKLPPLASMTGGSDNAPPKPPPPPDEPVTDAQIRDEARRMLHGRLSELGAKELQALVVEGMKLARAEAAARKKDAEDDDSDEEAVADMKAAGLRVV